MKNKILALIAFSILYCIQGINAQDVILKISGYIKPDESFQALIDMGIEKKINKNWSGQLSYTSFTSSTDFLYKRKKILTLQLRHYLGSALKSSTYYGFVLQKYHLEDNNNWYILPNYDTLIHTIKPSIKRNQIGLGCILGGHVKIMKRIGLDIHVGIVGQIGEKTTIFKYAKNGKTLPEIIETEKWNTTLRPFWGLNLYLILGKMPQTEK